MSFAAGGGAARSIPRSSRCPITCAHRWTSTSWIEDFRHANPDDVQLVLVQDGGPQVTLMANAGGSDDVDHTFGIALDLRRRGRPGPCPTSRPGRRRATGPTAYGSVSQLPSPAPPVTGNTSLVGVRRSRRSAPAGRSTPSTTTARTSPGSSTMATRHRLHDHAVPLASCRCPGRAPCRTSTSRCTGSPAASRATWTSCSSVRPASRRLLMSDVGGLERPGQRSSSPSTTRRPATFRRTCRLSPASYRPTNYGVGDDAFPAPAPDATGSSSLVDLRRHEPPTGPGACSRSTTTVRRPDEPRGRVVA